MCKSRRSILGLLVALFASACGGSATGVAPPSCLTAAPVTQMVPAAPTSLLPRTALTTPRRTQGLPLHAPDRLLVKFRTDAQSATVQSVHQQAGGSVIKLIPKLNVHVVKVEQTNMARVMALYRASPLVEFVENDKYLYAAATPNDTFYPQQWHYPAINLPAAWDVVTRADCVIVAVIDSGIRPHPDLTWVAGFDFVSGDADPTDPGCSTNLDDHSHGMHVSGTIAAVTNNGTGVAGVNWGGSGTWIMPIRALDGCGSGSTSDVVSGITYATDHGAKVINMSFAGAPSMTLESAINDAYARGVTFVAASGNANGPVSYPAAYPNVIAVGATACNNVKASYSNFGPELDLVAPGGDSVHCFGDPSAEFILSTSWSPNVGNAYFFQAGTSSAAPHVSGVAALLIARGFVGPANIQNRLQSTATDLGAPGFDPLYGWGLVNAAAAVGP